MKDIIILGIESSCDDTSAAVIKNGYLLSNVTAGQAVHEAYGGVVPELASRAHQQNIVPVVDQALRQAGVDKEAISAVAVTLGPGLMGSLLVGVSFAKGLAAALGVTPAQIVVRWHLQHGLVVIPKTTHRERMIANADVFSFALSDEQMAALDALDRGLRTGSHPDRVQEV